LLIVQLVTEGFQFEFSYAFQDDLWYFSMKHYFTYCKTKYINYFSLKSKKIKSKKLHSWLNISHL
ncbi:MAG: hypothetical protein ACI85O_001951, partial [Saprospiraceae bacterium]